MAAPGRAWGWRSRKLLPKPRAATSTSRTVRLAGHVWSCSFPIPLCWRCQMRGEGSPNILMVDDDPHVIRSLRAALESHGYEVRAAGSGPMALEACATERPDVVLLDLALPGLDGVEVCRRLRSWSRVPILVLSARIHEQQKVQA